MVPGYAKVAAGADTLSKTIRYSKNDANNHCGRLLQVREMRSGVGRDALVEKRLVNG